MFSECFLFQREGDSVTWYSFQGAFWCEASVGFIVIGCTTWCSIAGVVEPSQFDLFFTNDALSKNHNPFIIWWTLEKVGRCSGLSDLQTPKVHKPTLQCDAVYRVMSGLWINDRILVPVLLSYCIFIKYLWERAVFRVILILYTNRNSISIGAKQFLPVYDLNCYLHWYINQYINRYKRYIKGVNLKQLLLLATQYSMQKAIVRYQKNFIYGLDQLCLKCGKLSTFAVGKRESLRINWYYKLQSSS